MFPFVLDLCEAQLVGGWFQWLPGFQYFVCLFHAAGAAISARWCLLWLWFSNGFFPRGLSHFFLLLLSGALLLSSVDGLESLVVFVGSWLWHVCLFQLPVAYGFVLGWSLEYGYNFFRQDCLFSCRSCRFLCGLFVVTLHVFEIFVDQEDFWVPFRRIRSFCGFLWFSSFLHVFAGVCFFLESFHFALLALQQFGHRLYLLGLGQKLFLEKVHQLLGTNKC